MVGISHGSRRYFPCAVPAELVLIQQQTHQLRYCHTGMCIVQLKTVLFCKIFKVITMHGYPLCQHILQTGRGQKVLLSQPQLFAILTAVIRVQHH